MACFFHAWSDWVRLPGKCEEESKCTKCSKIKSRAADHIFEKWTRLPGKCEEQRTCSWCGYTEKRKTDHSYGNWEYVEKSGCTMKRICSICGNEDSKTQHVFGDRTFVSLNSCTQVQQCQRCGAKKIFFHCHNFTDWHYKSGNSCLKIRSCERCGLTECGEEIHEWRSSVSKDGQLNPTLDNPEYQACLQDAIKYINAQIKKNESILSSLPDSSDLNTRLKCIEQNHDLEIKKIKYGSKQQNGQPEILGDICERCWQVINWGITRKDLEERIGANEHDA